MRIQSITGFAAGLAIVLLASACWQFATDGTRLESSATLAMVFVLTAATLLLTGVRLRRARGLADLEKGIRWGVLAACCIALLGVAWVLSLTLTLGS